MTTNRYSVTAKDGSIHTRNSKRAYTHAIVGTWGEADNWRYAAWSWCGSLELARKQIAIIEKRAATFPEAKTKGNVILEIIAVNEVA
jgi:hypothetical protein